MAKPSYYFFDLCVCNNLLICCNNLKLCLTSSVGPSIKRLMARLNRHHSEISSFYGDFFKSLWLYMV